MTRVKGPSIESVLVLAIFYSVTIVWNVKGQGSKLHLIESVLVLAIFTTVTL